MDNLPNYLPCPDVEQLRKGLMDSCENFMKKNLKMQEDYQKYSGNSSKDIISDIKKMNYQVLNDNKNLIS